MEVIVDDTQLSLAIGKKGQNVRLAAKLLGWRIDIKSEEEKRQEVESQMAALVVPGAPVSVLIDHGLTEAHGRETDGRRRDHGRKAGRDDAGRTGSSSRASIRKRSRAIQTAVNSYYGQFESIRRQRRKTAPEAAPRMRRRTSRKRQAGAKLQVSRKMNLLR